MSSKKLVFSTNVGKEFDKIGKQFKAESEKIEKELFKRVELATDLVYRVARTKRPKIDATEYKALKKSLQYTRRNDKGQKKKYYVSNPNAEVGVPVDSGDLQSSIKKEVLVKSFGKFVGRVFIQGPGEEYANRIEFGWSGHQAPRSFMGSALRENAEKVKKIFTGK